MVLSLCIFLPVKCSWNEQNVAIGPKLQWWRILGYNLHIRSFGLFWPLLKISSKYVHNFVCHPLKKMDMQKKKKKLVITVFTLHWDLLNKPTWNYIKYSTVFQMYNLLYNVHGVAYIYSMFGRQLHILFRVCTIYYIYCSFYSRPVTTCISKGLVFWKTHP